MKQKVANEAKDLKTPKPKEPLKSNILPENSVAALSILKDILKFWGKKSDILSFYIHFKRHLSS